MEITHPGKVRALFKQDLTLKNNSIEKSNVLTELKTLPYKIFIHANRDETSHVNKN